MTGVLYVLSLFSDATMETVLLFDTQSDWHKMCRNLLCFQSLVRWHGAVSRLNCMMFLNKSGIGVSV